MIGTLAPRPPEFGVTEKSVGGSRGSTSKSIVSEPPKVLTSTTALPILAKADAAGLALGSVDVGATFFAMDVSTAWTSVVPTDLAIMPTDGSGFWVKTSTLPKP